MDASAGLTKNKKAPAPPPMPRPGLAVSREAARLGIGPVRRVIEPWTRPPDDIVSGDAMVAARNRFFTPLAAPTLSPNGARAGLGPDRTGPDSSGAGSDVPTRPDPALSRPALSRVGADIGTAAELAQARMLGLDTPPPSPALSPAGARAGLGPLVTGSPGDATRANTMARQLAQSVSQVRTNARALLGRGSTSIAPIMLLTDSSGRAGLTGAAPIAAAGKGFAMRVPKSPVAQDRERWASGTGARIAGASKGLGLAKSDWADHYTPPKPQPKRTWVGVQGDATENPFDTGACSDLALPPHAAVNKTAAPLRELEKERVPSDVCPPLQSSIGTLEYMLRRDAHLAATAPAELLRVWAGRPSMLRGGKSAIIGGESLKPAAMALSASAAMKGLSAGSAPGAGCGCNDCGCNGEGKKNGAVVYNGGAARAASSPSMMSGPLFGSGAAYGATVMSQTMPGGDELAALVESFAVRHGKDGNGEWFVAVFRRGASLVFGTEQRGPSSQGWHPDAMLGVKRGDALVATIHTHSRSAVFSEDDRASGNALGVPMVLIAPGTERARVYEPGTGTIRDVVFGGRNKGAAWKAIAKAPQGTAKTRVGPRTGGPGRIRARGMPRSRAAAARPITISETQNIDPSQMFTAGTAAYTPPPSVSSPQPLPWDDVFGSRPTKAVASTTLYARPPNGPPPLVASGGPTERTGIFAPVFGERITSVHPPRPIIDPTILARTIELAVENIGNPLVTPEHPERIWLTLAAEWKNRPAPRAIPDPDLFRAIVAVAQRIGPGAQPGDVLEQAKAEPLWVEPALLDLIIKFAQPIPFLQASDLWEKAWVARKAVGPPLPTPPDLRLLSTIVYAARALSGTGTSEAIIELAHSLLPPRDPSVPAFWPPYIATDLLNWVVFFAASARGVEDARILEFANAFAAAESGAQIPQPSDDLLTLINAEARADFFFFPAPTRSLTARDILCLALAERLREQLFRPLSSVGAGVGGLPLIFPGPYPGITFIPPPPPPPRTGCQGCKVTDTHVKQLPDLGGVYLGKSTDEFPGPFNANQTQPVSGIISQNCILAIGGAVTVVLKGVLPQFDQNISLPFHIRTTTCLCPDGTTQTVNDLVYGCDWICFKPRFGDPCDPLDPTVGDCCQPFVCIDRDFVTSTQPPPPQFPGTQPEPSPPDVGVPPPGICDLAGPPVPGAQIPPDSGGGGNNLAPSQSSCSVYNGDACYQDWDCCGGGRCVTIDVGVRQCSGGSDRPPPPPCSGNTCP